MADYSLNAIERTDKGTPASRRMRREGWVPGNVYGAGKDPHMVALSENELVHGILYKRANEEASARDAEAATAAAGR